jgi:hypothetical protein
LVFITPTRSLWKSESDKLQVDDVFERAHSLHFLFFAPNQGYHLRNGTYPHGAMTFIQFSFLAGRERYFTKEPFIYFPHKNYSNECVTVFNKIDSSIPFSEIPRLIDADPSRNATDGRHGAGNARDYGYCGNHNTSRDDSTTGTSEPRLRVGTSNKLVRFLFVEMTKFKNKTNSKWKRRSLPSDHLARSIDRLNDLHCLRIGRMSPSNLMNFHVDDKNPKEYPDVYALSTAPINRFFFVPLSLLCVSKRCVGNNVFLAYIR